MAAVGRLAPVRREFELLPAHLVVVELGVGGELFAVPIVHHVLVPCGEKLFVELHLLCVVRRSI